MKKIFKISAAIDPAAPNRKKRDTTHRDQQVHCYIINSNHIGISVLSHIT